MQLIAHNAFEQSVSDATGEFLGPRDFIFTIAFGQQPGFEREAGIELVPDEIIVGLGLDLLQAEENLAFRNVSALLDEDLTHNTAFEVLDAFAVGFYGDNPLRNDGLVVFCDGSPDPPDTERQEDNHVAGKGDATPI
jgi:hypothetical protein